MNKMNQVWQAVALAIQAQVPVIIWGPPGVGKTARVKAIGEALGLPVEIVIASHHDPTEFNGLPVVMGDRVVRVAPDWAKRLVGKRGIVFLDELSTAPPAVQAAALRFILERHIGDVSLPEVSIVAAANPPEMAAGGWNLEPPTANRFVHLEWKGSTPEEFSLGLLSGWPKPTPPRLPEGWEALLPREAALIGGFLLRKPDYLNGFPTNPEKQGRAWPSERTWEMAAKLLAACKASGVDEEVESLLLSGAVGHETALEFLNWRKEQDLPDPEALLANPNIYRHPQRGDIAYSILMGVVAAVMRLPSQERYNAAWKILGLAADAGGVDIIIPPAKALVELAEKEGFQIPEVFDRKVAPVVSALFEAGRR